MPKRNSNKCLKVLLVHKRTVDMNERSIDEAYLANSLGNTDLCCMLQKYLVTDFL